MRILFLHGWHSVPGGVKPTYLADHGHEVINPALSDDDFEIAVQAAQTELERHRPDVVVGSSRGGAIAMNLDTGSVPLVLLCPAWKRWGTAAIVKPGTTILHSRADETIPFAESEELVRNSGLPSSALVEVGGDHRLADPESLAAMLRACEMAGRKHPATTRRDREAITESKPLGPRPELGADLDKPTTRRPKRSHKAELPRRPRRWLAIVIGLGMFVFALCVWLCVGLVRNFSTIASDMPAAQAQAEHFLGAVKDGKLERALNMTSAEFKQRTPQNSFADFVKRYAMFQEHVSRRPQHIRVFFNQGGKQAVVTWILESPNNAMTCTTVLISEGDAWRVHALNVP